VNEDKFLEDARRRWYEMGARHALQQAVPLAARRRFLLDQIMAFFDSMRDKHAPATPEATPTPATEL
jgi:hypothetical protein